MSHVVQRVTGTSPCQGCTKDIQIGNPYGWQTPCYSCRKKAEWMSNQRTRLHELEDILGRSYDLDRLRELVESDRDDRCLILPCKLGLPVYRILQHAGCAALDDEPYQYVDPWPVAFRLDMLGAFGVTVFPSYEEAKIALNEGRARNELMHMP